MNIDDKTKNRNYPLLSTFNVPSTSHSISTLIYGCEENTSY